MRTIIIKNEVAYELSKEVQNISVEGSKLADKMESIESKMKDLDKERQELLKENESRIKKLNKAKAKRDKKLMPILSKTYKELGEYEVFDEIRVDKMTKDNIHVSVKDLLEEQKVVIKNVVDRNNKIFTDKK